MERPKNLGETHITFQEWQENATMGTRAPFLTDLEQIPKSGFIPTFLVFGFFCHSPLLSHPRPCSRRLQKKPGIPGILPLAAGPRLPSSTAGPAPVPRSPWLPKPFPKSPSQPLAHGDSRPAPPAPSSPSPLTIPSAEFLISLLYPAHPSVGRAQTDPPGASGPIPASGCSGKSLPGAIPSRAGECQRSEPSFHAGIC